jgi:hypothetical protein
MEEITKFTDKIGPFFENNPEYGGFVFMGIGLLLAYGSYKNWAWVFESNDGLSKRFTIGTIDRNFGRKTAQIFMGCVGLFFFFAGLGIYFYMRK